MTSRNRIAIVCQPWDEVVPHSGASIIIVAYQLARYLAGSSSLILYGRQGRRQKRSELGPDGIEFKRFRTLDKPQALIDITLGIVACYLNLRITYMSSIFFHPFYALRVALSIRKEKCNIVIVHNFIQFIPIIKLFNPSVKICLHMHCEWLTQLATKASERRLRKADLIFGVSNYITEGIRAGFPAIAARCHTVYNGADTIRFCPAPGLSASNADGAERLLYVGRLSQEKGVHILIRAFKLLAETRPQLHLDLIGAGHAMHYLYFLPGLQDRATASTKPFYGVGLADIVRRQLILRSRSYPADLAAEAGGDKRIVFCGGVAHTDTIDFYRRAVALVLPSVWNEPGPLPTLEAQACGTPVVSTRSGGIPEYVAHGQTGILVARGDAEELAAAISQVLDDPALARTMGEAGRQRAVERFSWEVASRRLADLIDSLAAAPGS